MNLPSQVFIVINLIYTNNSNADWNTGIRKMCSLLSLRMMLGVKGFSKLCADLLECCFAA